MNHSEQVDQVVPALLKAQGQFTLNASAEPSAIPEGVRLAIAAQGLGITQTFIPAEGPHPALFQTTLWHESGQWLRSSVALGTDDVALASFRRDLVRGLLGLDAEGFLDEDPETPPRAPGVASWRHVAALSVEHLNERIGRILQDTPLRPDQERAIAVNVHRLAVAVSKRAILEGLLRQPEQHNAAWSHKALEWLFAQDRDWVFGTVRAYAKEKLVKARAYVQAAPEGAADAG